MFKLIRDKIPEQVKAEGKVLNYATAENDELYIALLRNKLIEEVQEFLLSGSTEELVDIYTVIKTLLKAANVKDEVFEALYQNKLDTAGGFEKKYIGFFPDEQPVTENKEEK